MLLFVLQITPRHTCRFPAVWLVLPLRNYKLAFSSPAHVLLSPHTVKHAADSFFHANFLN